MPLPRGSRPGRRLVGGLLGAVVVSLACLVPVSSYADVGDDYPYAGLGKCPLVPLPPKTPGGHTAPGEPGQAGSSGRPAPTGQAGEARQARHPTAAAPVRQAHLVLQRHVRRPVGLRAAQLHELRRLAAADDQRAGRLREPLRRCALGQRRPLGRGSRASSATSSTTSRPSVPSPRPTHGRVGHVAWVSAVGDGHRDRRGVQLRRSPAGTTSARCPPRRSGTSTSPTSPRRRTWAPRGPVSRPPTPTTAPGRRVRRTARLVVHRPSGHTTRLRTPGGWSAHAAPSLVTDAQGRDLGRRGLGARPRVDHAHVCRVDGLHASAVGAGRVGHLVSRTRDGRTGSAARARHRSERHSARAAHAGRAVRPMEPAAPDGPARLVVDARRTRRHAGRRRPCVGGRGDPPRHPAVTAHDPRRPALDRVPPGRPRTWSMTSTPALADAPDGRVWLATRRPPRRPGRAAHRLRRRSLGATATGWPASGRRTPLRR